MSEMCRLGLGLWLVWVSMICLVGIFFVFRRFSILWVVVLNFRCIMMGVLVLWCVWVMVIRVVCLNGLMC